MRPHPWDSPGKNTGVGCHFLLQCIKVKVMPLSHVQPFVTPWTTAHQAPPSRGFSRQEYWSGVPLPSNCLTISNSNSTKKKQVQGYLHILKPCEALKCYSHSLRLAFRGENCLKAHPNGFLESNNKIDFLQS